MKTLAECLQALHENCSSQDESSTLASEHLIEEIKQICSRSLTKHEIGHYCSLLFQSDENILIPLMKNASSSEYKTIRELILSFLSIFVPLVGNYIQPYVETIWNSCINVFQRERYSRNKERAIQIIIQLVSRCSSKVNNEWINQLVPVFFSEMGKPASKTTSTVCGHCLHALGIMARYHPNHMMQHSERLFDIYLRDLKKEMLNPVKESDLKIIEGCLNGLNGLLFSFTSSYDEAPFNRCQDIYTYTKMSMEPQTAFKRYNVPIAGLQLFRNHASQFGDILIEDYKRCYASLEYWFKHKNPQLKHAAQLSIQAFLSQIATSVSEKSANKSSQDLFTFFITKFKAMISSKDLTSKEMSLAIQGYGLLAGPCKKYLSKEDVRFMFTEMMSRSEQLFLSDQTEVDYSEIHQLPTFLSSLANIVKQIEKREEESMKGDSDLPETIMMSLQRLCVLMIEHYPRLHQKFAYYCHNSLISVIHAFVDKPEAMKAFEDCIVYQGLIRSCSHNIVLGEERGDMLESQSKLNISSGHDEEFMSDILMDFRTESYKDYIPLWIALMGNARENPEKSFQLSANEYLEHRSYVRRTIFSSFLDSILLITDKLNLSTEDSNGENVSFNLGLVETVSAKNPMDFKIFVNLVDFCWEIFPLIVTCNSPAASIFVSHLSKLIQHFVAKSTCLPFVSGFYKLMAILMNVAQKVEYFSSIFGEGSNSSEVKFDAKSMDTDDGVLVECVTERQCCLTFLQKYCMEVASYVKQFKDELLASSLLFILNLPSAVATAILSHLTPVVQLACQIGVSYTPLAEAVLTAVDRWQLSTNHISHLSVIIPYLEPYLHFTKVVVPVQGVIKVQQTKSPAKKQGTPKEAEEPVRKQIRARVIKLFGSLGGDLSVWLEKAKSSSKEEKIVSLWDNDINIDYPIPFRDMKPVIRLDKILPRVMEVAEETSDRQTKVSACELLHSITIYVIGKNAQRENIQSTQPLSSLYRVLFPLILKLACNVDQASAEIICNSHSLQQLEAIIIVGCQCKTWFGQNVSSPSDFQLIEVCKQMFEPLVKQLIHWFTNNNKFESPDTIALLNAIIDGLVDENDASLRDFCSQSLCEFLVWSLKQNTDRNAQNNAKSIFKRIHSLALHPSSAKRIGAASAFNYLYRVFREQEPLVDEFVFELLVTFINSLALAHSDNSSIGTQHLCTVVLQHLERIISAKCTMLNKPSTMRRIPKGFENSHPVTLSCIVTWLFEQCGRPQTECRHQCMKLFHQFLKFLPVESRSAVLWIKEKMKNKPGFVISKFEGGCDGNGIENYSKMPLFSETFTIKKALFWFDMLLAALESYSWVFQQKMVSPCFVWSGKQCTNLFHSIKYFVCHIALFDLKNTACGYKSTAKNNSVLAFTPQEKIVYCKLKCTVTTRILQFITMLLKVHNDDAKQIFSENLWIDEILILLSNAVTSPSKLGFDTISDHNLTKQFSELSLETLSTVIKYLPFDLQQRLLVVIKNELLRHQGTIEKFLPPPFCSNVISDDSVKLRDMIAGYVSLHKCEILGKILDNEMGDGKEINFGGKILKIVFESLVDLSHKEEGANLVSISLKPHDVDIGNDLLMLAYAVGIPADYFIQCLFECSPLVSSDTGLPLTTTHGRWFMSVYSNQIFRQLCLNSSVFLPLITMRTHDDPNTCSIILSNMLEHLTTNRCERKTHASRVCDEILTEWDQSLKHWWDFDFNAKTSTDTLNNLLAILRKIITLDTRVCKDTFHPSFAVVFRMYSGVLSSRLSLSFKLQALDLLSCFTLSDNHSSGLKISVEKLVAQHFPLSSKEFEKGSTAYNDYHLAIKKLLNALKVTGNLVILEVVVNVFCRENDHAMSQDILNGLEKCVKKILPEKQKDALDISYRCFINPSGYSLLFRQLSVSTILVMMASHCDVTAMIEFFSSHIADIMSMINEESIKYPETKFANQLHMKGLAYRLMELMFAVLTPDKISTGSHVAQAYARASTQNKDSLLKMFMSRANRDKNENLRSGTVLMEERRKFHCAVYNAMIQAVICTQTALPWYKAFLLDENIKKNQYLLDNVIDVDKKYAFPMEISEPLKKRKRFFAIRRKKQDFQPSADKEVSYMESIAGSSLSEEVSVFDGNASRSIARSLPINEGAMLVAEGSDDDTGVHEGASLFRATFVELESDELNQHECMPTMVALFTHMHENSIGFSKDAEDANLPPWMLSLHRKLSSTSCHKNVRLFITKIVINCEPYFRQFASHWIAPLVQTMLRGDCGSNSINSLVCDVLATVLSWNSVAIPEDSIEGRQLVQGVLEHLSRNVDSPNRAIVRHNLDLVKTVLECWGKRIGKGINPAIIYNLCKNMDPGSKSNFAGLQLLGAFLANGIAPYVASLTVDRSDYFNRWCGKFGVCPEDFIYSAVISYRVFQNMLYKHKDIYGSAAEVAGMTLNYLTLFEREADGEIHSLVENIITKLSKDQLKLDKFIICLHKVAMHFSGIVDTFLSKILFLLPKVHGDFRTFCFEIVFQRSEAIPDLFMQLKSKNLVSMLKIRDEGLQLVCLRLCHRILTTTFLNEDKKNANNAVSYFLPELVKTFVQHSSPICRQEVLNIMMDVYDFQLRLGSSESNKDIFSTTKKYLLNAVQDQEEALRNQVLNFWSVENRIPIEPYSKLCYMLANLYDPSVDEAAFLSNAVALILQSASLSPDFERSMFENPLSDCIFQEYSIDHSWQHRHASMTPLFVDTLHTISGSPTTTLSPTKPMKSNVVMATQEQLQFSATIDGKNTYNWMTGNSLDTFATISPYDSSERSKSSLLVNVKNEKKNLRVMSRLSILKPGSGLGMKKLFDKSKKDSNDGIDVDVRRLRRRFTKETGESRIKYARVQEYRMKRIESTKRDQQNRLEHEIQLHRKYRVGELPDIQIPNRSIVAPLAAACQHDPVLTRLLVSSLIHSMIQEEERKGLTYNDVYKICEHLACILKKSEEKSSLLVGCVQDVALLSYKENQLKELNVSDVATASLLANEQDLGIVLLEKCIIELVHEAEPIAKRRKTTTEDVRSNREIWMELARLYKSLDEYDVLQGIFSEQSGSNALTAKGLSLETNGNYKAACKVYKEALSTEWSDEVSEVEKDLWEECLLNCLKNLCRWDQVDQMCGEQLASYDDTPKELSTHLLNVWNHSDFQQRYLDSFLHAKLLLLLQGNVNVYNELSSFMNESMKGEKEKLIERKYSEYLTMLYIYENDYDRAQYYLEKARDNFALQWSSLKPLMKKKRAETLRSSMRLSDIQDFLEIVGRTAADNLSSQTMKGLVDIWSKKTPHPVHDPIAVWNDCVIYRCYFLDQLKKKYESSSTSSENECSISSWIESSKLRLRLQMIENVCRHNNFAVAMKMISKFGEVNNILVVDELLSAEVSHQKANCYIAQARYSKNVSIEQLTTRIQCLSAAFASLNEQNHFIESNSHSPVTVQHLILLGSAYDATSTEAEGIEDIQILNEVKSMLPLTVSNNITGELQNQAYTMYKKAAALASRLNVGDSQDNTIRCKAFDALLEFCDKQLEIEQRSTADKRQCIASMMQYTLMSMKISSDTRSSSHSRFPRLLQLLETCNVSEKELFAQEIAGVPSWTVLSWLGHVVALLDQDFASALQPILWRVAESYPQALFYPLKAAASGFHFRSTRLGKENKGFFKKLQRKLQNDVPKADEFVKQLLLVSDPVVMFKDWKSDFERLLHENGSTKEMMEHYQNMYCDLFDCAISSEFSSSSDSSLYGTPVRPAVGMLRSKFAKEYKTKIDEIFGGSTGDKLPRMKVGKVKEGLNTLWQNMSKFERSGKNLKDYSHWLANFQPLQSGKFDLEIPGQYDGRSKPILEYHKTIIGFDERVVVMQSIRKPCRITIRGSDEKDYHLLVKGGEDLRQDQRIQRIFESVNDVLLKDFDCWKKELSIMTYQVIPVSSKVGLIEWVNSVTPYWNFLYDQSHRMKCNELMNRLSATDWVPDKLKKCYTSNIELHGNFMRCATYTDVVDRFKKESSRLPGNILREAYIRLAASPESFFTLRKRFIASYGTMCIAQWLLGIGDRHTSNFLISTDTGCVLGIDFGHAFGSATEVLPVPELVPFRLTRQVVEMLSPHGVEQGELRQVMVYCLSALRSYSSTLLTILNVFIKDPSLDWTRFAKKSRELESKTTPGDQSSDRIWYARRKMKIVEKKLCGFNPAEITCDEVSHNAAVSKFKKYYCSVARGNMRYNQRAREGNQGLNVEVQVDCLIDQATDPNVLGRAWKGWKSWL